MRAVQAFIVIIAMLLTGVRTAHASTDSQPATTAQASMPSYIWVIGDEQSPEAVVLPDSLFNAIAGSTIFKVNSTRLNMSDPFLQQLANEVLPRANAYRLTLTGIDLRGAASPEGPLAWNEKLSHGRAQALIGFLAEHLNSADTENLTVSTIAEDYPTLLYRMERAGDVDAPVVKRIIGECGIGNPVCIKQKLRAYNGGRLWRRLLNIYFPNLRSARIVLFFRRQPRDIERIESQVILPIPSLDVTCGEPIRVPVTLERRHVLSVSSNLLYDGFYMPNYGWAPMPNIGVEYYPANSNYTFRAAFTFPYYHRWSENKFFQIRDYHLEARRYFTPGRYHTGFYLGAYANATKYGIGLNNKKGWQGEGIGGALKAGWVLKLSARWRLDFHVALGMWITRFDPYVYGNPITGDVDGDYYYDWTGKPENFHRRNHQTTWFGPTEVGISLTYDLLYKRIYRRGVSLRRKEVVWP